MTLTSVPISRPSPWRLNRTRKSKGQVSGEDELVVVEKPHSASHYAAHVELADPDEEVAVEPQLDAGS